MDCQIREWSCYNFAAGIFHTKKLCSRLYSIEVDSYSNKRLYCRGTARRATSVEILWPFLTELLTRSSANPEEPFEHTISWNRVKCCINVRRIACENVCNRWIKKIKTSRDLKYAHLGTVYHHHKTNRFGLGWLLRAFTNYIYLLT